MGWVCCFGMNDRQKVGSGGGRVSCSLPAAVRQDTPQRCLAITLGKLGLQRSPLSPSIVFDGVCWSSQARI